MRKQLTYCTKLLDTLTADVLPGLSELQQASLETKASLDAASHQLAPTSGYGAETQQPNDPGRPQITAQH